MSLLCCRFASHKGWEFEPLSCHRNGIGGLKVSPTSPAALHLSECVFPLLVLHLFTRKLQLVS